MIDATLFSEDEGGGTRLPSDIATQRIAVFGMSGSGKTYGAGKIIEAAVAHGHQVVILDVVGNWRGLRLAADGVSPGIAMPVLGGHAGDAPLSPRSGEMVARLVATRHASVIVDLSEFVLEEQAEFVRAFSAALLLLKTRNPSPVFVAWEECHETLPQVPEGKLQARAVGAAVRLIKRGRNYGVGTLLISQRPAAVSKEAVWQCDTLVAFALGGTSDRDTIKKWATASRDGAAHAADLGRLPELPTGTAILWSLRWLRTFREVRILPKWTFDFSRTPDAIASVRGQLAPIDLAGLRAALEESGAEEDEGDVAALQAEIKKLRAELANGGGINERTAEIARLRGLVDAADRNAVDAVAEIASLRSLLGIARDALQGIANDAQATLDEIAEKMPAPPQPVPESLRAIGPMIQRQAIADAVQGARFASAILDHRPVIAPHADAPRLGKGERAILSALIQHRAGLRLEQLTVLLGYKRSARNTYVQRLRSAGLAETRGDMLIATSAGIAAVPDAKPLPRGRALREHWLERLPKGEAAILRIIVENHPRGTTFATLDIRTGYKRSARNSYLQRLRARGLVTTTGDGARASDDLFDKSERRTA